MSSVVNSVNYLTVLPFVRSSEVRLASYKTEIIEYLRKQREESEARKFADYLRAVAQVKIMSETLLPPEKVSDHARVIATINGQSLTLSKVEEQLLPLIYQVQEQICTLRKKQLDRQITNTLLQAEAVRRQLSPAALLETEVIANSE